MDKEFEALEEIKCNEIESICNHYNLSFDLITIREALFTLAQLKGTYGNNWENYNKKLKALEIIKDKEVNVHFLLVCMHDFSNNDEWGREEYNKQEGSYWHTANALTQEEYNLLKEVLL